MTRVMQHVGLATVLASTLCACGGGGQIASAPPTPVVTPSPAPSPTPEPTPTPPPPPDAFNPVPATIFIEPLYNSELKVVGNGWQDEIGNSQSTTHLGRNLRDAGQLSVSYDQTTGHYLVTAPIAGSGTLMRTEEYHAGSDSFSANPSEQPASTLCCNSLSVSSADRSESTYRYISFVHLFAQATIGPNLYDRAYGQWAVVQPTKPGDVPTTGTARYTGGLLGFFAGDAGATWLEGVAKFDFDFGRATLSGELETSKGCFMGCSYGSATYAFTNTQFSRGAATFSGSLTTEGAPSQGHFSGMFAGPNADELAAQFELPTYDTEFQTWTKARGVIGARRN